MGFTTKQVAGILGVPLTTLARATFDGRVPPPAKFGRAFLWDRQAVLKAGWALLKKDVSDKLPSDEVTV